MSYLFDTNHWSFFQRGHPVVAERMRRLPTGKPVFMSAIVQGEVLVGLDMVKEGRRRQQLLRTYQEIMATCGGVLRVDSRVAQRYSALMSELRRAGRPIPTNDIWIAATALVHDLTVATCDAHFGVIPGLRVEDWTVSGPQ